MALFSPTHDGAVSTTTRRGQVVSYRVSEHRIGTIFDSKGVAVQDAEVDGLSSDLKACDQCQPVIIAAIAEEAAAAEEMED
jgi:hypothetical protein